MNPILMTTLQGVQASMSNLDRIALNVANAQVPGFRRGVAAAGFDRLLAGLQEPAAADAAQLVHVDTSPGSLRNTGRDLDVAIAGEGWFEVRLPDGVGYTRRGAFRLDRDGQLVTEQGHPVMGVSGEIRLVQSTARIDAEGRVFDGSVGSPVPNAPPVGQLKVVRFARGAAVERLADGVLRFRGEALPLESSAQVRQGSLENANVSQATEMLQLMQAVRHIETLQKVALAYDEMLGTAVRRLGDLN
jgi:flagellar basal-body rod protein FlgF